LFVDDGNRDGSTKYLARQAVICRQIRLVQLSRNVGKEAAMTVGLDLAPGDAVVILDADIKDSPELIPGTVAVRNHYKKRLLPGSAWRPG
jgi:dolichol-phosphate mannosyltransferase